MDNDRLYKLAAIELSTLPPNQVVKVAGVVQRLKNWVKKKLNPEFRATLEHLEQDSSAMRPTLTEIAKEIEAFQQAMANGDLEVYNQSLHNLKQLTSNLWVNVANLFDESKKYYTLKEMEVPGFQQWIQKHLPANYDLDLGTVYNKPLKETKWYESLAPSQIFLSPAVSMKLLEKIKAVLARDTTLGVEEITAILTKSGEEIIGNFQKAVTEGLLISANVKKPGAQEKHVAPGTTTIRIQTAAFLIPVLNQHCQCAAELVDLSTSSQPRKKLSVSRTENVTLLAGKVAFANPPQPRELHTLSDVEFANAMRQGYQKVFGSDPTLEVLGNGWAQAVLESGHPIKLPNYNVGNIKAPKSWIEAGNPYFVKSTKEFSSSGKAFTHENAAWQAFPDAASGCAAYWRLIGNRYSSALKWMEAGDSDSATVALAMKGYFTASIKKYAAGVSRYYQEFLTKVAPQLPNLKSAATVVSDPKPAVKDWLKDYTPEEQAAIVAPKSKLVSAPAAVPTTVEEKSSEDLSEIDSLIKTLYADNSGPLTQLVKQAKLRQALPESQILLVVNNGTTTEKLVWAQALQPLLTQHLGARSQICSDNSRVELAAKVLGTPLVVSQAIQALGDLLVESFAQKTGTQLEVWVAPNLSPSLPAISASEAIRSTRTFYLDQLQ